MQVLKYFISKRDRITGEESSQFLSFLENTEAEISTSKIIDYGEL
jgi:hypothetical protein